MVAVTPYAALTAGHPGNVPGPLGLAILGILSFLTIICILAMVIASLRSSRPKGVAKKPAQAADIRYGGTNGS